MMEMDEQDQDAERRPYVERPRGRPTKVTQGQYMHILMDHEMHDRLTALSKRTGASKAHLVREALRLHLPPLPRQRRPR
jgi:hypothetical protein